MNNIKIIAIGLLCILNLDAIETVFKKANGNGSTLLQNLQNQVLSATNDIPGFENSVAKIFEQSAKLLANDKEKFKSLMMTRDDDKLSVLSHLVIEFDPGELLDTIKVIQKYWGSNHKPIIDLFLSKGDLGRSALYFAVLRKKIDMLEVLLHKGKEIFGKNKAKFLLFINGENEKGERELFNFRTPLILASYNDDIPSVQALVETALKVFGKNSKNFKEFLHARDNDGATAAFYARDETKKALKKLGINLDENDE